MLPCAHRVHDLVVSRVVEPREINMSTLRTWSIAISLMGCTVLNVTAKPGLHPVTERTTEAAR